MPALLSQELDRTLHSKRDIYEKIEKMARRKFHDFRTKITNMAHALVAERLAVPPL